MSYINKDDSAFNYEPPLKRFKNQSSSNESHLLDVFEHINEGCSCDFNDLPHVIKTSLGHLSAQSEKIMGLNCLRQIFESCLKHRLHSTVCSGFYALVENCPVQELFELLHYNDTECSASAAICLSLFCLLSTSSNCHYVVETLANVTLNSLVSHEIVNSFNVISRLVEHQARAIGSIPFSHPRTCKVMPLSIDEDNEIRELKCNVTCILDTLWLPLTQRFISYMSFSDHELKVVAFFNLWCTLLSIKNNLIFPEIKCFYQRLDGVLLALLNTTSITVWSSALQLYGEVLCYGSTIALQDYVSDEVVTVAHSILKLVKTGRFLQQISFSSRSNLNSDHVTDTDEKQLLQRIVVLILKAMAVTVKETRSGSSSDSNVPVQSPADDQDMRFIRSSMCDVMTRLDRWIKHHLPFHPEMQICEWLVILLCDHDDMMVEGMICLMDICTGFDRYLVEVSAFRKFTSVHLTFLQFLETVLFDHELLLDFLVSNETSFLLYLLRLLKYIRRNWENFSLSCGSKLESVMSTLANLRVVLENLVSQKLFPYDVNPIIKLLRRCEANYERSTSSHSSSLS